MQEASSRSFPVSTRVVFDHVFYLRFRQKILHTSITNISFTVLMLENSTLMKEFRSESLQWSRMM